MPKELLKTIKFNNEKTILELYREYDLFASIPYDGYLMTVSTVDHIYSYNSIYDKDFSIDLAIKNIELYKINLNNDNINTYEIYANIKDICDIINNKSLITT